MPYSEFGRLFYVQHQVTWTCSKCKEQHRHIERLGYALTLTPKGQALLPCITAYHRETGVEIRCSNCRSNTRRTRVKALTRAPEALFIQLARFNFDASIASSTKTRHVAAVPDSLNMSRWCVDTKPPARYVLQAVIVYSGTLKSGHYKAFVQNDGRV